MGKPRRAQSVVLVAHGSSDPRAAMHTRALAWAVGAEPSYLDHAGPRPGEVLARIEAAGHRSAVLVPLLLTAAYHGRVDIPQVVVDARAEGLTLPVAVTDVLGPVAGTVPVELLSALRGNLPAVPFDGIVLGAAGTRDAVARTTVDLVAGRLGTALGVPCIPAYASASGPTAGEAVGLLRAAGAHRVVMASYFLAPGKLYDLACRSALAAGAVAVAAPLGADLALVRLVHRRIAESSRPAHATAPLR
ncbi:sirohydrochlorin chelatase [Virgisporangium aliadipatigenens]|uniref:sirohydrochlorin chelatase n=1 Tax=Virgisporangium aliadipatigenens TaxID=741659 RepID=UPI0023B2617F|nr:CbiX/SirB N-terminal domain-containing protein [Virgisporangium aliadipatigenens]